MLRSSIAFASSKNNGRKEQDGKGGHMGIDRQIEAVLGYRNISPLSHCAAVLAFRAGKETASDGRIMFGNRNTLDSTYVCIPALGFILELDVPLPLLWPVGFVFSS